MGKPPFHHGRKMCIVPQPDGGRAGNNKIDAFSTQQMANFSQKRRVSVSVTGYNQNPGEKSMMSGRMQINSTHSRQQQVTCWQQKGNLVVPVLGWRRFEGRLRQ